MCNSTKRAHLGLSEDLGIEVLAEYDGIEVFTG